MKKSLVLVALLAGVMSTAWGQTPPHPWGSFPVGSSVKMRSEVSDNSGGVVSGTIVETTATLTALSATDAVVEYVKTVTTITAGVSSVAPPETSTATHPLDQIPPDPTTGDGFTVEAETLTVGGVAVACTRFRKTTGAPGSAMTTTLWKSTSVPGFTVKSEATTEGSTTVRRTEAVEFAVP